MKQKETRTYYPARFLYLLPIFFLQAQFESTNVGLIFGLVMAWFTAKFFPWIEYSKKEQAEE